MAIGYIVEVRGLNQQLDDVRYVGVGQMSLNNSTAQLTLTATSSATSNFGASVVIDMLRTSEVRLIKAVTEFPWTEHRGRRQLEKSPMPYDHDLDGTGCPKKDECANVGHKCGLCTRLSCFKPGKNQGKGARNEKNVAKLRNSKAIRRRGSGALAHAKGDIIDEVALHEAKSGYTRVDSKGRTVFSLQRSWLLKIEQEALTEGRIPVLELHYDSAPDDEIWAVVRAETLFELLKWWATKPK